MGIKLDDKNNIIFDDNGNLINMEEYTTENYQQQLKNYLLLFKTESLLDDEAGVNINYIENWKEYKSMKISMYVTAIQQFTINDICICEKVNSVEVTDDYYTISVKYKNLYLESIDKEYENNIIIKLKIIS